MSRVSIAASNVADCLNDSVSCDLKSKSQDASPKLSINGDAVDAEQWGRRLRIAFELADPHQLKERFAKHVHAGANDAADSIDTTNTANTANTTSAFDPDNPRHLRHALYSLSVKENSDIATQLELLVRFDDIEGWRESGAKHCADWMDVALGIDRRSAWERLRVGRKLRLLPVIQHLFRCGRLSWSKVRILVAVADPDNEEKLAHAALDATVRDVQRVCDEYRWPATEDEGADQERAEKQHERRRLSWQQLDDGSTLIQLILPPDKAQNFLHAIEHCEDLQYRDAANTDREPGDDQAEANPDSGSEPAPDPKPPTPSQRMADAAVLMAERSLAYRGIDLSVADRYLTVMNLDPGSLAPPRKPYIEGIGPIPIATAREITCDCSLIGIHSDRHGDPLSIGRRSRIWTPQQRLLITNRDRHCQFPGCSQHRFLHIHHIKHWADGGETSVDNGVCLCSHHHSLIHSGMFTIERNVIDADKTVDPHIGKTLGLESSAKRNLLPTRCRFRVTRVKPSKYEVNAMHEGAAMHGANAGGNLYALNSETIGKDDNKCCDGEVPVYLASSSVASVAANHIESGHEAETVHSSHSLYIECGGEWAIKPRHISSAEAPRRRRWEHRRHRHSRRTFGKGGHSTEQQRRSATGGPGTASGSPH